MILLIDFIKILFLDHYQCNLQNTKRVMVYVEKKKQFFAKLLVAMFHVKH